MVAKRLALLEAKKTLEQKEKEAKHLNKNISREEKMERPRDEEKRRRSERDVYRKRYNEDGYDRRDSDRDVRRTGNKYKGPDSGNCMKRVGRGVMTEE